MKRLKLFPKIFLYTLSLMLMITLLASGIIYLLAPIMVNEVATVVEDIPGIAPVSTPRNEEVTRVILGSLPYTIVICIFVSLICAFFLSRAFTKPIHRILDATIHMMELEKGVVCNVQSSDEIGELSNSINVLYQKLLFTIERLKEEKERVREAEKQKVDFLRVASHELKTPVTTLNVMLENMILEIGKYKDYGTFLPLCKEQTEQLGRMISEILDTSKLNANISDETPQKIDIMQSIRNDSTD